MINLVQVKQWVTAKDGSSSGKSVVINLAKVNKLLYDRKCEHTGIHFRISWQGDKDYDACTYSFSEEQYEKLAIV